MREREKERERERERERARERGREGGTGRETHTTDGGRGYLFCSAGYNSKKFIYSASFSSIFLSFNMSYLTSPSTSVIQLSCTRLKLNSWSEKYVVAKFYQASSYLFPLSGQGSGSLELRVSSTSSRCNNHMMICACKQTSIVSICHTTCTIR